MSKYIHHLCALVLALQMKLALSADKPVTEFPKGYLTYMEKLPKLTATAASNEDKAEAIVNFVAQFGNQSKMNPEGQVKLKAKVQKVLQSDQDLVFYMLGFPCKSANTEKKVIVSCFDLADYTGLATLNHLGCEIAKVYPKVRIEILNNEPYIEEMNKDVKDKTGDDIWSLESLESYKTAFQTTVSQFPYLKVAKDLTSDYKNASKSTEKPDGTWISQHTKYYYEELDFASMTTKLKSNSQRKNLARTLCDTYFAGVQKLRKVVAENIPAHYLRVSIQGSVERLELNPIFGGKEGMPWHTVCVVSNAGLTTQKKMNLEGSLNIQYVHSHGLKLGYVSKGEDVSATSSSSSTASTSTLRTSESG